VSRIVDKVEIPDRNSKKDDEDKRENGLLWQLEGFHKYCKIRLSL
jgi:hypothetical protein